MFGPTFLAWVVDHYDRPFLERLALSRAKTRPVKEEPLPGARTPVHAAHVCRGPGCEVMVYKIGSKSGKVCEYCSPACAKAVRALREKRVRQERKAKVKDRPAGETVLCALPGCGQVVPHKRASQGGEYHTRECYIEAQRRARRTLPEAAE